jgi:AhpD family alkylhydroperoxidase
MKSMFGSVPVMFNKLPLHVRASAWEWFKTTSNPNAAIPPKYGELISLAVASQIPCEYCIYAHTTMAKMHGASEQEIQEAVMKGAEVRHWSTILNGNQVDFESFKTEWDAVLAFIKANSGSK